MCLPDLENLTFSIPFFFQITYPSVYHVLKKSIQFLFKLGAFYHNLLKMYPIYVYDLGSFVPDENPPIVIPKSRHIIRIPYQCETPGLYIKTKLIRIKGWRMGPLLVLVSPCFRENVVVTCQIGSFLCSLDNLLQKNVIVAFFGNQISKWRSFLHLQGTHH